MKQADELQQLLLDALERAGEAQAEIHARAARRGFARFALGELSQHMYIEEPQAFVRVAHEQRVAEVGTTELELSSLVAAIHQAAEMARHVPPDDSFPGFAGSDQPAPPVIERYAASTAACTPERRVELLAPVLRAIADAGLFAAGVLDSTVQLVAVATTSGLARSHASTAAQFRVWATESGGAGGASGHGWDAGIDVNELSLMDETERAIRDAELGRDPLSLAAGSYDVVLDPLAVAELLEWLGYIAMGARVFHQGTSPLAGRLGERISGDALSLYEDPLGEFSIADPFDREGVARQRVAIIERGVARGVLYDRAWAARHGVASTGSASVPWRFGEAEPAPTALVMQGGEASTTAELVEGLQRGLYVRRLHYVNGMLEPRRAVMTGLTRDGTFLVEQGRRTRAVGTMRFTDSLLEAFERADGLTRERRVVPSAWFGAASVAVPAVRIRALRFTSGSQ